jgi:hypothetical protein
VQAGTGRFRGVTGAEAFGREPPVLDGVAAWQRWYWAAMPHDTRRWWRRPTPAVPVWSGRGRRPRQARLVPGEPVPQRVEPLAAALPPEAWHPYRMKEGRQGPLVAACACPRGVAVRVGWPGPEVWIVCRRAVGEQPELTVDLSNAPAPTPVAALVRVAGMRWPSETVFEESKGGRGLDHDEVRSGLGWHPHRTLWLLAPHCLVRARLRLKKGRQR